MAGDRVDPQRETDRPADDALRGARLVAALTLVVVLSVAAGAMLLVLSPHGAHATNDSFTYLGAADQVARGDGWTYPFGTVGAPVTLFPPLYPAVLSVPELVGVDPFAWVTWQNAVLLAVLCSVVGATATIATRGSVTATGVAIVLTLLGTPTIVTYARIWSESIFLPLVVGALVTLDRYLVTRRTRWLVGSGALVAVAMLTRYSGLSVFAASCLLLLVWPRQRVSDRLRALAIYGVTALPASVAWLIRNQTRSGSLTGNNELVHSLSLDDVMEGVRTIGSWLVHDPIDDPTQWTFALVTAGAGLVLAILSATLLRRSDPDWRRLPSLVVVCLTFVLVHFSFIAIADAFSTRAPPFNDRILGPAFAPLVIAVVVLGHWVWVRSGRHVVPRVLLGIATISLVASSIVAASRLIPGNWGTEAGSKTAYEELARALEDAITPDAAILSNRPNVAWFVVGRSVTGLPRSCRGGRVRPNPTFIRDLRMLARRFADEPRQVLVFRRSRECSPFSLEAVMRTLRVERRARIMRIVVLVGPMRRP